jgi:hypothetical protein
VAQASIVDMHARGAFYVLRAARSTSYVDARATSRGGVTARTTDRAHRRSSYEEIDPLLTMEVWERHARALADVPVSYPRCVVCPQNEQQMTLTADL